MTNTCLKAGLHVYCEKMNKLRRSTAGKAHGGDHGRNRKSCCRSAINGAVTRGMYSHWNKLLPPPPPVLRPAQLLCMDNGIAPSKRTSAGRRNMRCSASMFAKYGHKDMHQFRNWRCKVLGPRWRSLVRSGCAPQIDIFDWWLDVPPNPEVAGGGLDYFKNHDWYDNAMVIWRVPPSQGSRALSTRCRQRKKPAAATSKHSWGITVPSKCQKIRLALRHFIVKRAPMRSRGTTWYRRAM